MANIICYNKTTDQAVLDLAVADREAATFTVELPDIWVGGNIHCWMYFSSPDDMTNSISQYVKWSNFNDFYCYFYFTRLKNKPHSSQ